MMSSEISAVLEFGAPEPGETASLMEDKLRFHTDSWDLSVDLKAGLAGIVVIDARSHDAYAAGHIPGAISFPHREMSIETTTKLDRGIVYVVYCDGIGCNASTKGAYKLARLGFRTKELLGGLDWWRRDGILSSLRASPVVFSPQRNSGWKWCGVELRCRRCFFITHPDVAIDPAVGVPDWPLNGRGAERMRDHGLALGKKCAPHFCEQRAQSA